MTIAAMAPVVLIGAGKMGGALLDAWLANGAARALSADDVTILDPGLPEDRSAAWRASGVSVAANAGSLAGAVPGSAPGAARSAGKSAQSESSPSPSDESSSS